MTAAILALLLSGAQAAEVQGWRYDGSGRWPASGAPVSWSEQAHVVWSAELPAWSNASPVVMGDRVCTASEPTTLVCVSARTGEVLWAAENPVVDAVPGARRAAVEEAVTRSDALEARLSELRGQYSLALRKARAAGGAEATAAAEALAREIDRAKAELSSIPDYRTPPNKGMIGWSSPTPATDGTGIYGLFANGVIAAYERDGRRRWIHWLGHPLEVMLGWDEGHAASPLVVGDLVVAPFRRLTALHRRTGEVVWEGPPWPHYGPPVALTVSGVPLLITPAGQVLRASDGKVVREGLADVWYFNPIVDGDRVYFVEARSDLKLKAQGGMDIRAWQFASLVDGVLDARELWTTRVPMVETPYATPVVADGWLHMVTHTGHLWTLDASTGAVTQTRPLTELQPSVFYASPAVADGRLYLTDERGITAVFSHGAEPELLSVNKLWPTRSSPAFAGKRVYLRTAERLAAIE